MKTLFTVRVGEFLVGDFIERKFRSINAWVPYKHTGVALLITDPENQRLDVAIECAGNENSLAACLHAVRRQGAIVQVGLQL